MSVTDSPRAKVRQAANNRCGYWQIDGHLVYAPMEIDHLLPQAKGGSDEEDNLWIACLQATDG